MNGRHWWERGDLGYRGGRLQFAGQDLEALAAETGTPTFVYSAARVRANLERLRAALDEQGVAHDAFYAIKANRYAPLVSFLQQSGRCGIDACSPAELLYALKSGFAETQISYTGTSVSETDLDVLAQHPGVHVNCDAISTIRRLGRRCPGRRIGIRINPELGAGYNEKLRYAGDKPTKFGIYRDRFDEALAVASEAGMPVETLHFHIGSGYQGDALEVLDEVLRRTGELLDANPQIRTLNVGGGLGLRVAETDVPVDLERWASIIARHVVRRGVQIQVEPGDYLVKDAGILLVRANTVEDKAGTRFVGVDAGLGIESLYAYYRTPMAVAPTRPAVGAPSARVTIAGNINEAMDLLAEDVDLPPIAEGDLLALLNVGGYGSAAASNH
ncbi:MAG: diaminopimelate decarboxylase, partial [Pseudomonadota bacterium]|nr:diaminopimelate decarboxylase [Pseudomonadota bacterium]